MTTRATQEPSPLAMPSASADASESGTAWEPIATDDGPGLPLSPAAVHRGRTLAKPDWIRLMTLLLAVLFLGVQAVEIHDQVTRRAVNPETYIAFARETMIINVVGEKGEDAGFHVGDHLIRIGNQEVNTLLDYRRALNQYSAGSKVMLSVDRDGQILMLAATVEAEKLNLSLFLRNIVAIAFLVMGALVILQNPDTKVTRLFFITVFALGLYFVLQRTETHDLVYLQAVALTLTPALAIHFFLEFPEERSLAKTQWWFLLYIPSLILMALLISAYARAVAQGTGLYMAPLYWRLIRISFGYLGLSGAIGLLSLGYAYTTTSRPIVKRQIQWIMWGLACGIVTIIIDMILTLMKLQNYEVNTLLLVGVLPLPMAVAFAIFRYRLLDIDLVVNRSVVYGLLTAALAAVYLILISLLSTALGVAAGSGSYTLIVFVSALFIGVLVSPLRSRIQAIIDRVFFRRQLDYQRALSEWSQDLGVSLRFSGVSRLLCEEVPRQLLIERTWLLVLNQDETYLEPLSASSEVEEAEIGQHSGMALSVQSPLAVRLNRPESSVLLGGGEERQRAGTDLPVAWRDAGVRVGLPLVSGGYLVGVYLLGPKLSGDIYQRQELDLLRTLSNQAAVTIANARLYEEIHAFSQELEDKVQERTKELRSFVAAIYHELSTPLTAMRGYTAFVLDGRAGALSDKQVSCLTTVRRNIERLMRLVADLSDISRIDDGRLTIYPEPVNLQEAVEETVRSFSSVIAEKDLQVSIHLSPQATTVAADPQRLVQILTNLVSNACRYTMVGGQITIASRRIHGLVELTVEDTGIGIRKDELHRIFERFYRSDEPLVRDQPGTGMGLSITKSLVELHGSHLWVRSEVGNGSTFGFTLAVAK
jgi:signal transduction histidine kinase